MAPAMAERRGAARKKERENQRKKERESKRTRKGTAGKDKEGRQPLDRHRLIYNAGDNRIHDQNPAFRGIDGSPCAARRRDDSGIFK